MIVSVDERPEPQSYSQVPWGEFAAVSLVPRLRSRLKWATGLCLVALIVGIWVSIAAESAVLVWIVFAILASWWLYLAACTMATRRHGIAIPQLFIDRHGLLKVGVLDSEQYVWSDLTDFIVHRMDGDGGAAYFLLAYPAGEPVPDGDWAKYRRAALRLSLPYWQQEQQYDEMVHNSLRDWLNEWRKHVLADGPWPHSHHLLRGAGSFDIQPLSDIERERSWLCFQARSPGIRQQGAGSQ